MDRSVTSAASWQAPRAFPLTYPGAAPAHPYLLVDDEVVPMVVAVVDGELRATLPDGRDVDEVLVGAGLAPMAERVPVVAYGANRNPHTLALKMDHHGGRADPDAPVAVPVLVVELAEVDVVVGGLSGQGYLFADLAPSPGTTVTAALTLLDATQAGAVHRSEGVGSGAYDVASLPGVAVVGTDAVVDALAYVGGRPVVVSPVTGTPLAFARLAAEGRTFPALDQPALLAHLLEATGALGPVADALDLPADPPAEVAAALARALNRRWWARRAGSATDGDPGRALREALDAHRRSVSSSARAADGGHRLAVDEVMASGPALRLGARTRTAGA